MIQLRFCESAKTVLRTGKMMTLHPSQGGAK
jgi:hypothetical protein